MIMSQKPINTTSLDELRPDRRVNAELFVALMLKWRHRKVKFSSVYRNDAYQANLYAQGRTKPGPKVTGSQITTFHGEARLAFDFYQDAPTVKEQWQDKGFYDDAHEILQALGFSRLSSETAHAQDDGLGKFKGSQVRAGILPPKMYDQRKTLKVAEACGFTSTLQWFRFMSGRHIPPAGIMQAYIDKVAARLTCNTDPAKSYEAVDSALNLNSDDYWRDVLSGKKTVSTANLRALNDKVYAALS